MKTLRSLTILLVLFSIVTSCDEAKDLIDTNLNFSLDETFTLAAINGQYSNSKTFSALDDGNISDNIDNVKGYKVEKVSVTIEDLVGDDNPSVDNLSISIAEGNKVIDLSINGPIVLSTLEAAGETEIELSEGDLNAIRDMIASTNSLTLSVNTTISNGPASFDITVSIAGKVTVGI